MPATITVGTHSDYMGVPQDEAVADLAKVTRSLKAAVKAIGTKAYVIGHTLNSVRSSDILTAAAFTIESGERDFSEDGRTTAVGRYAGVIGLTTKRANDYMQLAQRRDELTEAGIDPSKFGDLSRKVKADTRADDFTSVVADMLAADVKVTAATFNEAGRAAGIVAPAKAGGGGDPLLKAANDFLKALAKAEDLTATQKRSLKAVQAAIVKATK